ncbi:hypothetical protein PIB30_100266, partial [Stylosanthes scabra]|nr:hypothetical protein [Stylosanthes scabra]
SAVRCRKGVGGGQRAGADRGDARGDKGRGALYREIEELKSQWWWSCSSALGEGRAGERKMTAASMVSATETEGSWWLL